MENSSDIQYWLFMILLLEVCKYGKITQIGLINLLFSFFIVIAINVGITMFLVS